MRDAHYLNDVVQQVDMLADALDLIEHLAATAPDPLGAYARGVKAGVACMLTALDPDWRVRRMLSDAAAEWVDRHGPSDDGFSAANGFLQLAGSAYQASIADDAEPAPA